MADRFTMPPIVLRFDISKSLELTWLGGFGSLASVADFVRFLLYSGAVCFDTNKAA